MRCKIFSEKAEGIGRLESEINKWLEVSAKNLVQPIHILQTETEKYFTITIFYGRKGP